MKWATRSGPHVDRTACAWLIRRFIDPGSTFVFVEDPDEVPPDATAFDMRGAELSHRDGGCSFETFLRRYSRNHDVDGGRPAACCGEPVGRPPDDGLGDLQSSPASVG